MGVAQGFDAAGFDGNDAIGVLQAAFNRQKGFLRDDQAQFFKQRRRHNRVRDAGFIFEADKDEAFGRAWALAANHVSGYAHKLPVARFGQIGRAPDVAELGANQRHWMRASR